MTPTLITGIARGEEAKEATKSGHSAEASEFVHGAPAEPGRAWKLAVGGRLYDRWWDVVGVAKPQTTHPAYPKFGKQQNGDSWRCVECHGWDYLGRKGESRSGDHFTGVRGVNQAAGAPPAEIEALLRSAPHNYTPEMIPDQQLKWLALFISQGQHNARKAISTRTHRARGDAHRGREIFQTVCAVCHGYEGKAINFGSAENPSYLGTEANGSPYEFLHRIRNSPAGTAMVGLRSLPLSDAVAVLAYAQTLPVK